MLRQFNIYDLLEGSNPDRDYHDSSLTSSVSEQAGSSIKESVSEPKNQALQRFLARAIEKTGKPCINKYSPGSKFEVYYRLSYRQGSRIKHRHIRGGNSDNPTAIGRANYLQQLIDGGASIEQILQVMNTF